MDRDEATFEKWFEEHCPEWSEPYEIAKATWQAALAYVRENGEGAGLDAQEAWNQRADDANQWNNLGGDEREDIVAIWEHGYAAGRRDYGKPFIVGVDLAGGPDTTAWYCPTCGNGGVVKPGSPLNVSPPEKE